MTFYLTELAEDNVNFPPVHHARSEPDGLLAIGGDLSVKRLVNAYRNGIFPWFNEDDPLLWWSPSTRALFAPDSLKLNRTLRRQLRAEALTFTVNHCFSDVVKQCAAPRKKQSGTWIVADMQQAYCNLHQIGVAHSVEVWQQQKLVGGVYGVMIDGLFCGESMFNRIPNAAKFALIALQNHVQKCATGWIDCQLPNPFLLQLGAQTMPRADFMSLLRQLHNDSIPTEHWLPQAITL